MRRLQSGHSCESGMKGAQRRRAPLEAPDAGGFESGPKEPVLARAAACRPAAGQRDRQRVERVDRGGERIHQDEADLKGIANGSLVGSLFHSYSSEWASRPACSFPQRLAIRPGAMSVPADTPDDVMYFPSSIQRALPCQSTEGSCCTASEKKFLLELALRPFSTPASASSAEPVPRDVVG